MSIKVCKFGGSSLADAAMIDKARRIVEADPSRRYVVPSAPGKRNAKDQKITDLLYLCHEHAKQDIAFDSVFEIIAGRYRQIIAELGVALDLDEQLEEVRRRIADGAGADYTASRGEYLNGHIIAAALGYDFVDPVEIIHFDARGRLNPEDTQTSVKARLAEHERAVVPGFYGSMPDGTVKTFSRGGSDITGAIVARGVHAAVYENWTDVSGLLMADPRIVENPLPIEIVTYKELRELAYMGATVLHDEAIFPVRQAGIPVNIRNTHDPDHPGTLIVRSDDPRATVPDPNHPRAPITGIAGKREFTALLIEKALMNAEIGYGRRLLSVLEDHEVSFEHMPSGIDTISVVIEDAQLNGKRDAVLDDIRSRCKPDSLEIDSNLALIATVGRGMAHHPGMAARLFNALGDADVNIRMIDQGSSELNIIVGINADDFETAMRAIYAAFVNQRG